MIIDAHIHISENGKWFDTDLNCSVDKTLYEMDRTGIDKAVVLFLHGLNSNKKLYNIIERHIERFIPFCTLDLDDKFASKELGILINEYAFRGLKIHPRLQCVAPYSEKLFNVYEKAIELGIPITFDGYSQSNFVCLEDLQPYVYDKLAKRYPELKIIIAHAGGHRLWDAYFVARSNKNVYLDVSYILKTFENTSFIKDLSTMFQLLDQKIIYGSDYPEINMFEYYSATKPLIIGLDDIKQNNIFSENIIRIIK